MQTRLRRKRRENTTAESAPPEASSAEDRQHATDELLDEIDAVLTENAEEFVRGFVQKGGE